jgi:glutamate racemase
MADLPQHLRPAAAIAPAGDTPLVGVFDSGLGGLSVLGALHAQRPGAPLLYVADSGNAPYGERTDGFVIERSLRIAGHLLDQGAGLLVMACNTATAVAAAAVRERWPHIPVVGVEPAIKPAVLASPGGRIGVMATPITLRSDKFKRLVEAHGAGADILLQPCPGLAGLIEQGDLDAPALLALIESQCRPLKDAGVDTVVLGCTHYPFVQHHIQAAMGPAVRLIDTADAVARQVSRRLDAAVASVVHAASGPVRLQTTGDVDHLAKVADSWLDFPCDVAFADGL